MIEGGGRGDGGDRAREEFFSEAQEIVDGLSRDLLALDEAARRGGGDAELVNDVFRAVHTLKGLSGLFGAALMSGLSHELEDLLDDLRLGRIELSAQVLDLLFRSVELYGRILGAARGDGPEPAQEVKELLAALGHVAAQKGGQTSAGVLAQYELDPGLLGVLTEYEEHRLRSNLQAGLALYRMRVSFLLATIDSALDELKAKTRPLGEIITFLPTGEGGDAESVELEILVASRASLDELRAALAGAAATVEEVRRRDRGSSARASYPEGLDGAATPVPPPLAPASSGSLAPPAAASLVPPPSLAPSGGREVTLRSVTQTVRVDIRKLDHLMNIVGELGLVRSAVGKVVDRARRRGELGDVSADLHRIHRALERHLGQLQNGILEVRMVPLGQVFDKLARIVRQISREHDKSVNLVITGSETEIDKLIVEELSDPLMHMMRNAIDHAIEDRDGRMAAGKPAVGTIALNAFQKGNHVVVEVEDDGRGMSRDRIVRAAIQRGLVTEEAARDLDDKEALDLVFAPGFTTKDEATSLSGRGVGMDVVKTNIGKLGGVIDISSELGIGTKMTIVLPITLAIISVLVVEVAGRTFCVPLASVEEAFRLDARQIRLVDGREVITQRGATLPLVRLAQTFELRGHREGVFVVAPDEPRPEPRAPREGRAFVVLGAVAGRRVGFVVDDLVGQQDIVIKALGPSLQRIRGVAGATDLGDQRVGLVLDTAALIEEALAARPAARALGEALA